MKQRIFSIILVFSLLLGAIPFTQLTVFAGAETVNGVSGVVPLGRSARRRPDQQAETITCEVWQTTEITLGASDSYNNPFLEVEVTGTFISEQGTTIIRPGFWDGDNVWKVRFAPTEVGDWSYYITSNQPTDIGLSDTSGVITSVPYTGEHAIYQKGFLTQDASNRYLTYADGTPFFWLGDTHWFFANKERWDESNLAGTTSQFQYMVDQRVSQDFTVYQTVLFGEHAVFWADGKHGTEINPDYFKDNVDAKMKYIAEQGLVNAFGVGFSSNVDNFVDGERRLAKYTVARYGTYPMAYITAGEGAAGTYGERKTGRLAGWEQVARETHRWDSYNHPQTAHYTALSIQATETGMPTYYIGQGWMDFIMLQGGHSYVAPQVEYQFYYDAFPLPMMEAEANYEMINNGWATPEIVRRSAYRSIQAGGFGYTYGANGIWNAVWDDADVADESGYGHVNWDEAIHYPGADQMGYMRGFYESIPFETLAPIKAEQASWSNEVPEYESPVIKADEHFNTITVFYPPREAASGELQDVPNDHYDYSWFNPRTGTYEGSGTTTATSSILPLPQMPDNEDWMLLLERQNPQPLSVDNVSPDILLSATSQRQLDTILWTLPSAHEVSHILLSFPTVGVYTYRLEGSMDGTQWTTLLDRSGAGVYGKQYRENLSGEIKYLRIQGLDSTVLDTVELEIYGKRNQFSFLQSNQYRIDQFEHIVRDVPEGIFESDFRSQIYAPPGATVHVQDADESGRLFDDSTVVVQAGDGSTQQTYQLETVENEGENIALRKPVTASSVESPYYSAEGVTDGNKNVDTFHGWSADILPAWIIIDFEQSVSFNKIKLYTKRNYEISDYTAQYLSEGQWIDCFAPVVDNQQPVRSHFFPTVTTTQLRVLATKGSIAQEEIARIQELEVYCLDGNLVESITVSSEEESISTPGGTLQMTAEVLPATADISTVSWRLEDDQGQESRLATISRSGLLTAQGDGQVRVIARARDGSEVEGERWITITGQSEEAAQLLSQDKPAQASDQMGHATASQAVDGIFTNGWLVSSGSMPHWLTIDLEETYDISRVEQTFFEPDDYIYKVEGSLSGDDNDWFLLYSKLDFAGPFFRTFSHEVSGQARYIRFTILDSTSQWAGSREFQVFGFPILQEYTVVFQTDDTVYHRVDAEEGNALEANFPAPPNKTGYRFLGWFTQKNGKGEQLLADTPIVCDWVVYAHYEEIVVPAPTVTVTFLVDDSRYYTETVRQGEAFGERFPAQPQKAEHRFLSWGFKQEGKEQILTKDTILTKDLTVYPRWEKIMRPQPPTVPDKTSPQRSTSIKAKEPPTLDKSMSILSIFKALPVTKEQARSAVQKALLQMRASEKKTAYAVLKNPSLLSAAVIEEMQNAAGDTPLVIYGDTRKANSAQVQIRLRLPASELTEDVNLFATQSSTVTQQVKERFQTYFQNNLEVLALGQTTPFEQAVEIALKTDIPMEQLVLYHYNQQTNTYTALKDANPWMDTGGYLHFTTQQAGIILVVNGTLEKK